MAQRFCLRTTPVLWLAMIPLAMSASTPSGIAVPPVGTGPDIPAALTTVPSEVVERHLIKRVDPVYGPRDMAGLVQATVKFAITVTEAGTVTDLALTRGPASLIPAAEQALLQWRYTPFTVDGKPARVRIFVDLPFSGTDEKENDCRGANAVQEYSKAEPACAEAVRLVDQLPENRSGVHIARAQVHALYGQVLEAEHKYKEALAECQQELAIAENMRPQGGAILADAHYDVALAYQMNQDPAQALMHYERAEHLLREARKHKKKQKDGSGTRLKRVLEQHAELLAQAGHNDEAAALSREADQIP